MIDLARIADYVAEINQLIEEHESDPIAIYL